MKKVFNSKLYKDGIRQLLLPGVILAIVTALTTVIPIVMQLIEIRGYMYSGFGTFYPTHVGMHLSLMCFMFVGGYILPYNLFKFVNKRNASDFYDSLPNTRLCTYLSLGLSAITWIVAIVFENVLCQYLMSFFYNGGRMELFGTIKYFLFYAIASLIVAASTMMGISLTGTPFTNFVASGLVLLLPRAIITVFEVMAVVGGQILSLSSLPRIISPANNFVVAVPFSFFFNYRFKHVYGSWKGYVYSFVLFLIVFALGAVCYIFRRSETAGKPSSGRLMQAVFRCSITFPFLALFFGVIIAEKYNTYFVDAIYWVILVVIAICVYFIYEAVTTKSLKCVLKSVPTLVLVFALTAGVCYGGAFTGGVIRQQVPTSDEVEFVQIKNSAGSFSMTREDEEQNFYDSEASKIEYTDEDTINAVLDILSSNAVKDTYDSMNYITSRDLIIKLKNGTTLTREVKITNGMLTSLEAAQKKNEDYKAIYNKIPDASTVFDVSVYFNNMVFAIDDKDAFMEVFSADAEKNGVKAADYISGDYFVSITGSQGNSAYSIYFDVSKKNPDTLAYIKSLLTDEYAKIELEGIKAAYENNKLETLYITLGQDMVVSIGANETAYISELFFDVANGGYTDEEISEIISILESAVESNTESYNVVSPLFTLKDNDSDYQAQDSVVYLTDKQMDKLISMAKMEDQNYYTYDGDIITLEDTDFD